MDMRGDMPVGGLAAKEPAHRGAGRELCWEPRVPGARSRPGSGVFAAWSRAHSSGPRPASAPSRRKAGVVGLTEPPQPTSSLLAAPPLDQAGSWAASPLGATEGFMPHALW